MYVLRPHHGMCLAFFEGKGYNESFTAHMGEMLDRLMGDPVVRLTVGVDEICQKCPHNRVRKGFCDTAEKTERYDRQVLFYCGLQEGEELSFLSFAKTVKDKILEKGLQPSICGDCCWNAVCSGKKPFSSLFTG